MSKKQLQNNNIGRKFIMFVKPIDEKGLVLEQKCGWLKTTPKESLVFSLKEATEFVEKEPGHGSFEDWKKFFEEDHPNWIIVSPPKYLD